MNRLACRHLNRWVERGSFVLSCCAFFMNYLAYTDKLASLQYYITHRNAVTVNELAERLGVSRRTVLRMLNTSKSRELIMLTAGD